MIYVITILLVCILLAILVVGASLREGLDKLSNKTNEIVEFTDYIRRKDLR